MGQYLYDLTSRELECIRFASDGLNQTETAQRLALKRTTVSNCLGAAREKLHARTDAELVGKAVRQGIIQ